jgi:predicted short-subunit dehydrogenase-like oxidoreductase (DUF2520 family)
MQVTIIGSGNVGTVLGRSLAQQGHSIRQVYSRNPKHAGILATELGARPVSDLSVIDTGADLYLLTITDDALPAVAAQLLLGDKPVLHTAGAVSRDVLKSVSTRYGVLWPMKMIRGSMMELGAVSIVIDGNTDEMIEKTRQFASQFSTTVSIADDNSRIKMHMIAAVVSNFTNHLYHLSAEYSEREGIDFSIFYPIIEETARQVQHSHPSQTQAGPAFRGDIKTVEKHKQLLLEYPALERLYEMISFSILEKTSV